MKEVWAVELDLLNELIRVCEKYGLKYFADSGTLLGVVRHNGFIPWDDDIDIIMPRKDYDRLTTLATSEFKSPYFFQCVNTEKNYYRGHSQLRYDGTAAILSSDVFLSIHQGIFIDIFVFDSIPDNKDSNWYRRLNRANKIYDRLYNYTYGYKFCINPIVALSQLYNLFYCSIVPPKRLYEEFENLFRYYDDKPCKDIAYPCLKRIEIKTFKKNWYRKSIYLPFENIRLPVPIEYDKVLRTQYGNDYMIPQKSPSMHGAFIILDPNRSYTEYLPILRKEHKKNFLMEMVKSFKSKFNFLYYR